MLQRLCLTQTVSSKLQFFIKLSTQSCSLAAEKLRPFSGTKALMAFKNDLYYKLIVHVVDAVAGVITVTFQLLN